MSRRDRGRRERGERYALLPLDVLRSAAWTTLPHAHRTLLTVVAAGYDGHRNGAIAVTQRYARLYGIGSGDSVYRGLLELRVRGLIARTRRGWRDRRIPTLYAIDWCPITWRDGAELQQTEPPAHRYRRWTPGTTYVDADGSDSHTLITTTAASGAYTAEIHTGQRCDDGADTHRSSVYITPASGAYTARYAPILRSQTPDYTPGSGDTLDSRSGGAEIERRIGVLITRLPHLLDADVVRSVQGATPEAVARVRARIAAGWRP